MIQIRMRTGHQPKPSPTFVTDFDVAGILEIARKARGRGNFTRLDIMKKIYMQYKKFFIRIQRMRISCCVKIHLSQSFLIFQYHSRIKVIKIVGKAYKSTTSSSASSNSSFGIPKLPIDYVRAELVSKIREHDILIVMGETGSGKTTQLPQYIQDARLINGQIGVTQVCFIFVLYFTNETVKLGVKVDLLYQCC